MGNGSKRAIEHEIPYAFVKYICYIKCSDFFGMKLKVKIIIFFFGLLITVGISFSRASAALIGHWKFDEGTGTSVADSSGNGTSGTLSGTNLPTWSADVPPGSFTNPYSLDFSRTGDVVTITWPSLLNFSGTATRSFSFWYKPTGNGENASGNYDRIMSWSGDAFEIAGTLGDITVHRLAFYDGNWRDTGYDMTPGTWYHITFTYDGTNVKLYVDDTVKFSGTSAGRDINGTMYIGLRHTGDEGINGRIDDFRIYDTALTTTQIANLTAGSSNPDVAPDSTAPVISAISATATSSGATITWTTDEAASTKVLYSADTSYGSATSETDTSPRVTSHSKTLSGLLSCTRYNYKVYSTDAASNSRTSDASSFTTTGCAGGAVPSASTSASVATNSSATTSLSDSGRVLSVQTPANFVSSPSSVVIQINSVSSSTVLGSLGKPSSSLSSAAVTAFDVKALIDSTTLLDSFNAAVTMSYQYSDSDIAGLDESSLRLYHHHNSSWRVLNSCSIDVGSNTITCTTPSFSIFALFGSPPSGGGLPPGAFYKPVVPKGGFTLALQKSSGSAYTVTSNAGSDVKYIALSTDSEFKDVGLIPYQNSLIWGPCQFAASCPSGAYTVYAKFYTAWGQQSGVVTSQVVLGGLPKQLTAVPCPYFTKYVRKGMASLEVRKIKQFLNDFQSAGLSSSHIYDNALVAAVKKFQAAYSDEILAPWGFAKPTGLWYQSTMKKANTFMGCYGSVKLDNGKVLP